MLWFRLQEVNIPRGWQARASIIPAPPPAMRFVAADVGLFPPGFLTFFADIGRKRMSQVLGKKEERVLGVRIVRDTNGRKGRVKLSRRSWKAWTALGVDHIGKRDHGQKERKVTLEVKSV